MKQPNTRLTTWVRERRRRNGPNVRDVYNRKNVIDLAGWNWARAAQIAQIADDQLKLATAELRAAEDKVLALHENEIALIAAEVLSRLVREKLARKARKDSRRKQKRPVRKSKHALCVLPVIVNFN